MKQFVFAVTLSALMGSLASPAFADRAVKVENAIWANGNLYGTVLTDTGFHAPPAKSTDTLYNFGMSGLSGQRAVSESAPGDTDFNGGRWSVKAVAFTAQGMAVHDPDGDGVVNFELKSQEDVLKHEALGHITIMDTAIYFECPLIP